MTLNGCKYSFNEKAIAMRNVFHLIIKVLFTF